MIAVRRTEGWPSAGGLSSPPLRWLARLSIPVLVISAFLCGAGVAAVVFVGFWGTEAGRRQSAETSLHASRARARTLSARTALLQRRLADATANLTRVERAVERRQAATAALLRQNSGLIDSAGGLHTRAAALERRASSVSGLTGTLGSDLVGLMNYLSGTDASAIDPAYVKAQLNYLRPAIEKARAAAGALGGDARTYGDAVERFAQQASAYATALGRLQR
jgi:hypothetical protein